MVGAVVKIRSFIIVEPRQGLFRAATVAYTGACARLKLYRAAAHLTLEYHFLPPPVKT